MIARPVLLGGDGRPVPRDKERDHEYDVSGVHIPHVVTFIARTGGASNTYWHQLFDEALKEGREQALAMRRDSSLMALVKERMRAVANLPWHLEVEDERSPRQRQVRDGLTRLIGGNPELRRIIWSLLNAIWYGRYGVQVKWGWKDFRDFPPEGKPKDPVSRRTKKRRDAYARALRYDMGGQPEQGELAGLLQGLPGPSGPAVPGVQTKTPQEVPPKGVRRRGLVIKDWWPVNGDKIGHHTDHTPYVLVNASQASEMQKAEFCYTTIGKALTLSGTWRELFIIHRHEIEDADFFAPQQAEAIHGLGIRSEVFWTWWLRQEWLRNVTDFFDRVGLGLNIWYYPRGDDRARQEIENAAKSQTSRAHIIVPRDPDANKNVGQGVERQEVPTTGADALVRLVEYMDRIMERFIVGQEGSSRSSSSDENSVFQQATKFGVAQQDASFLAATLTGSERNPGLVNTTQKYTYPWADFPVRWSFQIEKPESEKKLNSIRAMIELGAKVKADDLRSAAGLSRPAPGDELIEPPQQPGMPPGVPSGQPGMPPPGAAPPPAQGQPQDMLDVLRMKKGGRPEVSAASVQRAIEALRGEGRPRAARELARRYREMVHAGRR